MRGHSMANAVLEISEFKGMGPGQTSLEEVSRGSRRRDPLISEELQKSSSGSNGYQQRQTQMEVWVFQQKVKEADILRRFSRIETYRRLWLTSQFFGNNKHTQDSNFCFQFAKLSIRKVKEGLVWDKHLHFLILGSPPDCKFRNSISSDLIKVSKSLQEKYFAAKYSRRLMK